jgi:uncharacterized membrane protein
MADPWILTAGLAAGTFSIRVAGYALGRRLPDSGPWARGLNALPGCLILSLVVYLLLTGGPAEWGAGALSLAVAFATRSLPLTMLAGVLAAAALRAAL